MKLSDFNPKTQAQIRKQLPPPQSKGIGAYELAKEHRIRQSSKALNKTEARFRDWLVGVGHNVMEQAITLRLDPPFKSYRADLAYVDSQGKLVLTEVKAPHRFMEKGIAKAALAAKTYPMFRFELALWKNKEWKISVLSA